MNQFWTCQQFTYMNYMKKPKVFYSQSFSTDSIEEEVAFVLLAGDLYDGDWKDYSTGILLSRQMGRLG